LTALSIKWAIAMAMLLVNAPAPVLFSSAVAYFSHISFFFDLIIADADSSIFEPRVAQSPEMANSLAQRNEPQITGIVTDYSDRVIFLLGVAILQYLSGQTHFPDSP